MANPFVCGNVDTVKDDKTGDAALREKNLFREHGSMLKEHTNELFSKLKDLRTKMDKEFNLESGKNKQDLYNELDGIDAKIKDGQRLQAVFDELKKIQQKLKNLKSRRVRSVAS